MNELQELRDQLVTKRNEYLATVEPAWVAFVDQQTAALRSHLNDLGIDPTDPAQGNALLAGAVLLNRLLPLEPFTLRVPAGRGVLGHIAVVTQRRGS